MEKGKSGNIRMPNNFEVHDYDIFKKNLRESYIKSVEKISSNANNKRKIYFAGPWFDERSCELYDVCKEIFDKFKFNNETYFPREAENETPLDAFQKNVTNIKFCDIVVALVSKKDVGTAWEIGMAYAMNKEVYLLGYDDSTFLSHTNVMLAFTGKCLTLDKLGKFLSGSIREEDFVKINNCWEGIE